MLPNGFLGTRGDVLMDLVILSFLLVLPALLFSWQKARKGDYRGHRTLQLTLALALAIAVALFEIDLKMSGGIFELTSESAYAGTALLNSIIYGHTAVAVASVIVWVPLVLLSLYKFGNPPQPGSFSGKHRRWGRVGMMLMMASGISALPLYYIGFAL